MRGQALPAGAGLGRRARRAFTVTGAGPHRRWRDGDAYAYLRRCGPAAMAWEWLRRDPGYRVDAAGAPLRTAIAPGIFPVDPAAHKWGLHAFEDPARPAPAARPVWHGASARGVLRAAAVTRGTRGNLLDLSRFAALATVVVNGAGREHVLLSDGWASLRIDLTAGSLTAGPACLAYDVRGLASMRAPLAALGDLLYLSQSGRLRHRPPGRRNARLILLLRTHDALVSGANQREIASALLSAEADVGRWRSEVSSLRSRAQRLVRGARMMAGGGYHRLLAADP